MTGKCSAFGGPLDSGMSKDTGVSFYEPHEADLRPDLFVEAPFKEPLQFTWKRLRNTSSFYIALPLPMNVIRKVVQEVPYKVSNPKTGRWAPAFVVDRGPAADTGRVVDCSDFLLEYLGVKTDDLISVEPFV